jgi:hypothetical protein
MRAAVVLCALALAGAARGAEKPKLVVLDLAAGAGVDPSVAGAFTASVAEQLSTTGLFDIISSKDIQTLLGLQRQRQMLGCKEQDACVAELADALGARYVLTGAVTQVGQAFQLSLQGLDSQRAQPLGRSTRIASDLDSLRRQIPYAVAEATGTPAPPPPSHLVPASFIGGGGLMVLGGILVGLHALSLEASDTRELELGLSQPAALRPAAFYQAEAAQISLEKTLSLTALLGGAVLVGVGEYLELQIARQTATRGGIALRVGPSGILVRGEWP